MLLIILIKLNTLLVLRILNLNLTLVIMLNVDKRNIFSKGYTSNWNRELFKANEVLKTQPPTYKIGDINGEIIEGKYYEQELLKSEFDFESNNKVLESLNIFLEINNDKK